LPSNVTLTHVGGVWFTVNFSLIQGVSTLPLILGHGAEALHDSLSDVGVAILYFVVIRQGRAHERAMVRVLVIEESILDLGAVVNGGVLVSQVVEVRLDNQNKEVRKE
jgi:uncharacterized integral membrane protein